MYREILVLAPCREQIKRCFTGALDTEFSGELLSLADWAVCAEGTIFTVPTATFSSVDQIESFFIISTRTGFFASSGPKRTRLTHALRSQT